MGKNSGGDRQRREHGKYVKEKRAAIRDQRHYEPESAEALMNEFPGWSVSQGTNQRWFARREDSALVSGEDLLDVRDQIIGWIWRHEQ